MEEELIAPCGINCKLCIAYQFKDKDINKRGFHRRYCPGWIPRGSNCLHMGDSCDLLKNGIVRFCYECEKFPCKRLKALDKRYRSKYQVSAIDNLNYIRDKGLEEFLSSQDAIWKCKKCNDFICCHNGLCLTCEIEVFVKNPRYRWDHLIDKD